jgi:hypothetical protein
VKNRRRSTKNLAKSRLLRHFEVAALSALFPNVPTRRQPMQRYDPLKAPDPQEWLALDEQERIALAQDYHRRARIRLPNATAHATAHAIVENQIALGDETLCAVQRSA